MTTRTVLLTGTMQDILDDLNVQTSHLKLIDGEFVDCQPEDPIRHGITQGLRLLQWIKNGGIIQTEQGIIKAAIYDEYDKAWCIFLHEKNIPLPSMYISRETTRPVTIEVDEVDSMIESFEVNTLEDLVSMAFSLYIIVATSSEVNLA